MKMDLRGYARNDIAYYKPVSAPFTYLLSKIPWLYNASIYFFSLRRAPYQLCVIVLALGRTFAIQD